MAFDGRDLRVPDGLVHEDFVLRPLHTSDAERDYAAVIESRDRLRLWEQSSWPDDDFSVEGNREDLERHERLHDEGRAFTYTVDDPTGADCLGCVYLFPSDAPFIDQDSIEVVGGGAWADVDATVSFWARTSRRELEPVMLAALRSWLSEGWDLGPHVFVVSELFAEQVDLVESAGLELRFRYRERNKEHRFLCFAEPGR